jgi:hypothetical protein
LLKEEIIVTTHLRNAAGVCALSIGLLVCSSAGAVAFADQTEAGSAPTGAQGATTGDGTTTTSASTSSDGPTSTVGNQRDDEQSLEASTTTTLSRTTTTTGTSTTTGESPTTKIEAQTNTSSTTSSTDEEEQAVTGFSVVGLDEDEVGATPTLEATTPPAEEAITPSSFVYTPPSGSNSVADAQKKPADHDSAVAAADTRGAGATTTRVAGLTDREPGPFTKTVVLPVNNAVVTIAKALGQVTFTLSQLPTSQTPVTDVIMSMSMMVGSVVGAVVEVAQVPGDLVTLLGATPDAVRPPLIGAGGAVDRMMPTPVDLPLLGPEVSHAPQLPVVTAESPLFPHVTQPSNIGSVATTGLKNELSFSGLAPVPSGISPATTSFLDHVVSSVLVPASLTALAAIAVPGLGGLLIVCVAGIRVGYRQAKAGLALRASGIARFAGPGPMGVVRSGGLIALHSRAQRLGKPPASRTVRAKAANGPRLLESVA